MVKSVRGDPCNCLLGAVAWWVYNPQLLDYSYWNMPNFWRNYLPDSAASVVFCHFCSLLSGPPLTDSCPGPNLDTLFPLLSLGDWLQGSCPPCFASLSIKSCF